ncbi:YhbD family protein [Paenibacillus hodogayensis]|uniref:YhbD family protein n=1 Tax=Paenibacillus hodogayensis TaxID=279208 RepID=A0ABV5W5C3_9BACL
MEQELISKKELLELTDISYGQLYRWKRKNLIPEQWFVRKSTFTGQETFFPKQSILARIDKIKNMKDDLSLDELADVFSPAAEGLAMAKAELTERNIVSPLSLELFERVFAEGPLLPFGRIVVVYMLDKLLQAGDMSLDEGKLMLETIRANEALFENKSWTLVFTRKMGASSFLMLESAERYAFDGGTKIVSSLSLASALEELKLRLS